MNMILTSECEECIYGVIDDRNKARVKVKCVQKDKEYKVTKSDQKIIGFLDKKKLKPLIFQEFQPHTKSAEDGT